MIIDNNHGKLEMMMIINMQAIEAINGGSGGHGKAGIALHRRMCSALLNNMVIIIIIIIVMIMVIVMIIMMMIVTIVIILMIMMNISLATLKNVHHPVKLNGDDDYKC